jgi:predicted MFS family arabinose efflux permease
LGVGQIVSWGSLYYSFPVIAEAMGRELELSKPALYGAATVGVLVAGLASYPIGAAIDRGHGRAIMTLGSILGGALLLAWSRTTSQWMFYLLFGGIGLAQAMTMYEPAFAVVTRRYGAEARRGITALTLWGGFASTVFLPLTQWLVDRLGWRDALLALGACNLLICVGLYASVIEPRLDAGRPAPSGREAGDRAVRWVLRRPAFWGLLVAFTVYYGMYVGLTFHLYALLLERGLSAGMVVSALAIIGPAQVAARVVVWVQGRKLSAHAIGLVAMAAFTVGLALLMFAHGSFAAVALATAVWGGANGVITIVRGLAVPEMLTQDSYGAINGILAFPANVAKAVAPALTAGLWAVAHSYDPVLVVALVSAGVAILAFWFAVAHREQPQPALASPASA